MTELTQMTEYVTNAVIVPGAILEEELEARGLTQRELARQMGRPEQTISEIVHGKKAITGKTALQLEEVLGISAETWMRLEAAYQLDLARKAAASSTKRAS